MAAILATGWGGLTSADSSERTFVLDGGPQNWLFPRCAAVMRHSGAGLRTNKPSLIMPFFGDQPFLGKQIASLGAGPNPIPVKRLNSQNRAEALREATTNTSIRQCAEELAARNHAQDGVANVVDVIAKHGRAAQPPV